LQLNRNKNKKDLNVKLRLLNLIELNKSVKKTNVRQLQSKRELKKLKSPNKSVWYRKKQQGLRQSDKRKNNLS